MQPQQRSERGPQIFLLRPTAPRDGREDVTLAILAGEAAVAEVFGAAEGKQHAAEGQPFAAVSQKPLHCARIDVEPPRGRAQPTLDPLARSHKRVSHAALSSAPSERDSPARMALLSWIFSPAMPATLTPV